MSRNSVCELCRATINDAQPDRYAGLVLCHQCYCGELGDRLEAARGFTIEETVSGQQVVRNAVTKEFAVVNHEWTLTGTTPRAFGVVGTFTSEDLLKRLKKIVTPEIQTGDELFDRAIYISDDNGNRLRDTLVQNDRLRDAIMEVVSEMGALRLQDHKVSISYVPSGDEPPTKGHVERALAIIMHELDRLHAR